MAVGKLLERGQDDVLRLAVFGLSSGENEKSIPEEAASRAWMKQRWIDSLQNRSNVVDLASPQNSLVPLGAGYDARGILDAIDRLRRRFIIKKDHADRRLAGNDHVVRAHEVLKVVGEVGQKNAIVIHPPVGVASQHITDFELPLDKGCYSARAQRVDIY